MEDKNAKSEQQIMLFILYYNLVLYSAFAEIEINFNGN